MSAAEIAQAARLEGAVLVARNAVAADTAGLRGAPRGAVVDLSLALGRGVHAILGAPEDGTLALADLVSGRIAPSRGSLTIAGRSPARDASVRRRVAHLAHTPDLPDARDVGRSLDLARDARGDGDPRAMLHRIGAKQLITRRLPTLTHGEARAVDAAIALSAPSPVVVVAHEPFADLGPASATMVETILREHAQAGASVLFVTSSPRDASRIGDDVLVLDRGRFVRGSGAGGDDLLDPPLWPYSRPRRMELLAHIAGAASPSATGSSEESPARAIARRLSSSAAVSSVSWEEPPNGERGPSTLRIAGPDESACALALLDAADAVEAAIVGLSPVPATLFEVRMATEQLRVAATWHARMQAMTTANAMTLTAPDAAEPPADVGLEDAALAVVSADIGDPVEAVPFALESADEAPAGPPSAPAPSSRPGSAPPDAAPTSERGR